MVPTATPLSFPLLLAVPAAEVLAVVVLAAEVPAARFVATESVVGVAAAEARYSEQG